MLGVVIIAIALVLVGPVAVMLGGALWSAIFGWLQSEAADERAGVNPA